MKRGPARSLAETNESFSAFAVVALAAGSFFGRPVAPTPDQHDTAFEPEERRVSATHNGFDVHCAVRIGKDDDEGLRAKLRPARWLDGSSAGE